MMYGVARVGDRTIGVCRCHEEFRLVGGKVITGSANTFTNARSQAKVGDIVLSDCGHTGVLVTGKQNENTNGYSTCVLGSRFEGCYSGEIVSASGDVF